MQNVSMQLVEALKRRDDVVLDTMIMRSSWKHIGLKTFFFLVSLLWKIPSAVKKDRPDVILFSSMVTAGVMPFLIKNKGIPYVTINHGQDVTLPVGIYQWYLPSVFKRLDGVISVSSATREACIKRGMAPEKGISLPNGFDAKIMKKIPEKQTARSRVEETFDFDLSDTKLLLSVGRQVKRKGHEWFIEEVFSRIQSKVNYLVVGDGPENENICRARDKSTLKEKIVIAGKQPGSVLNFCYAAADLFVMPNIPIEGDMEGFGIVLLEANMASVPAIASDLEGIKDVVEDGINGYRVPHKQPQIFAEKIDYVLNNELYKLSKSSKEYVKKHFSWDTVVDKYLAFLKRVTERDS